MERNARAKTPDRRGRDHCPGLPDPPPARRLRDLGGSLFLSSTNLQQPSAQEFLKLFQSCTPAQQERVMGPGLVIEAAPGTRTAGPPPSSAPEGIGPALWRLE